MVTVKFTSALKRFFPNLQELEIEAYEVCQLIQLVEKRVPGLSAYIVDEQAVLRKHVNIFVNGELITDRIKLSDKLDNDDEVFIMQALSGG